jgi:uncharacterized protein YndB with AHSA1/START domain
MNDLSHQLQRTLTIKAPRDVVFRYFTDSTRWARWWGAGSSIEARPGGRVLIRYPGGTEATGEVLEAVAPDRLVFTYGYAGGTPIPPGGSRVTIRLDPVGQGTRLHLVHEFQDPAVRDQHVQGWRYQLSLFANVVLDERHEGAAAIADAWFEAWSEADAARREEILRRIAVPDVRMHDRFSAVEGIEEISQHLAAAQRFMPGVGLQRHGPVRHSGGMLLVEWTSSSADGTQRGRGTNVFTLAADGRIESVTGFWAAPDQA